MDRASPSTALNNGMISNVDVNVVLLRCFRSLSFLFACLLPVTAFLVLLTILCLVVCLIIPRLPIIFIRLLANMLCSFACIDLTWLDLT